MLTNVTVLLTARTSQCVPVGHTRCHVTPDAHICILALIFLLQIQITAARNRARTEEGAGSKALRTRASARVTMVERTVKVGVNKC